MGVGGDKNAKSGPPLFFMARGADYSGGGGTGFEAGSQQPLLSADAVIKRGFLVASDQETYLDAMEKWSSAKSSLAAASYASGVADFSSVVGTQGNTGPSNGSSLLESSRRSCFETQSALAVIVELLEHGGGSNQ